MYSWYFWDIVFFFTRSHLFFLSVIHYHHYHYYHRLRLHDVDVHVSQRTVAKCPYPGGFVIRSLCSRTSVLTRRFPAGPGNASGVTSPSTGPTKYGRGGARGFIFGGRTSSGDPDENTYLYKSDRRFFKTVQWANKCLYRLTDFTNTAAVTVASADRSFSVLERIKIIIVPRWARQDWIDYLFLATLSNIAKTTNHTDVIKDFAQQKVRRAYTWNIEYCIKRI